MYSIYALNILEKCPFVGGDLTMTTWSVLIHIFFFMFICRMDINISSEKNDSLLNHCDCHTFVFRVHLEKMLTL